MRSGFILDRFCETHQKAPLRWYYSLQYIDLFVFIIEFLLDFLIYFPFIFLFIIYYIAI